MTSLHWDDGALDDLQEVGDYINGDNPAAARRVVNYITGSAERLRDLPLLGKATDEPGVRTLVLPRFPYVIVYQVAPEQVRILAVLHYRQQRALT